MTGGITPIHLLVTVKNYLGTNTCISPQDYSGFTYYEHERKFYGCVVLMKNLHISMRQQNWLPQWLPWWLPR